jgi:hypothetical protein
VGNKQKESDEIEKNSNRDTEERRVCRAFSEARQNLPGCGKWVAESRKEKLHRPCSTQKLSALLRRTLDCVNIFRGETRPRSLPPFATCHLAVYQEVVLNEEDGMESPCAVNLHNAVTVSQQRLGKRVAQLSSAVLSGIALISTTNPTHPRISRIC